MAQLKPFRALRPVPERAAQVAAVPYDVVNREESLRLAEGNPWSFLHVSRPEIDLPAGIDPYSDPVYAKARSNFEELAAKCPLIREESPMLYVYRLRRGEHVQTGVAATFSIDDYDSNLIKKHERTRKDKEDDRTRHVVTLKAQTGPVFLAFRGTSSLGSLLREAAQGSPLYDFTASDGVGHTVWRISAAPDLERWVAAFREVPSLYIADGHHRAASASRARAALRAKDPKHTGQEDYNFFLAVAFPAEELRILPYNRVVRDLAGMNADEFLQAVSKGFAVSAGASSEPRRGEFALYLQGRWYGLKPLLPVPLADADPIRSLDVSVLQDRLLDPVLGIRDPRTDKRIDFVGGIRGTAELAKLVDSGEHACAFSLHPTTPDDLMRVSDAGEIMPPKSTWFEPKLRDGLLSHLI